MSLVLVPRSQELQPATPRDFVGFFSLKRMEAFQADVSRWREDFVAEEPTDHREFQCEMFRWHGHITGKLLVTKNVPIRVSTDVVVNDLERWYGHSLDVAERNAIYRREGGICGVLDAMTERLIKERKDGYIKTMFWEYLPTDDHAKIRLAEELIAEFGPLLPDDERPTAPAILAGKIKEHILKFAEIVQQFQKSVRS